MNSIRDIGIGQRFSFSVYPTAVIGNTYRDVRLEGTFSAQTALTHGFDVEAVHQAVYPSLPSGTPNNPFSYEYIRIQHPNGAFEVIGVPWIRTDTLEISEGGRITLVFEDKTQADLDRMTNALSSNGFYPDDVRVERQ